MRDCNPPDYFNQTPQDPRQLIWLKTSQKLDDHPNSHYTAAAFASDHYLLRTSILPLGFPSDRIEMMVSLDHSM